MKAKNFSCGAIFVMAVVLALAIQFWYVWVPIVLLVTTGVIYRHKKRITIAKADLLELSGKMPPGQGYVVFDFETSGLYPAEGERVVQLGLLLLDEQLFEVGSFQTLFNPQRSVGPTEIHGISQGMVRNQPKFKELAPELFELFNGRTVIAHNVEFDAGFLASEFEHSAHSAPNVRKIDTLQLARDILENSPNHKLPTVVNQLNIDVTKSPGKGNHDAVTDAWYVWQIFLAMVEKAKLDPTKLTY